MQLLSSIYYNYSYPNHCNILYTLIICHSIVAELVMYIMGYSLGKTKIEQLRIASQEIDNHAWINVVSAITWIGIVIVFYAIKHLTLKLIVKLIIQLKFSKISWC